jgi:hypothetical protein
MQHTSLRAFLLSSLLALGIHMHAGAITVFGSRTCGDWIQNKNEGGVADAAQGNWLMGYMSGIAIGTGEDVLSNTSAASMELWVSNYCAKNPLDRVSRAGTMLFFEMKKRAGQ